MTEIKKTLSILRARWPEVVLIIGLGILSLFVNKLILIVQPKVTSMQVLIDLGYLLLVWLILIMLTVGFQRTVYLEGEQRQSPTILLRTGWYFFGRMFKLFVIWLPVYCVLIWLTFLVTKRFIPVDTGFFKTAQSSPLLYQFCFMVPSLILIKPLLLMPALVIVLDCQVLECFKYLKKCRLFDAEELLILFLTLTIFTFSWSILPKLNEIVTISQYVLTISFSIAGQFISLMVAVTAIRFVGGLNLVYDVEPTSLDFEDSHKCQK